MPRRISSNQKYFIFLIWVLMLQSLRNVNMLFYMGFLLIAYTMLYVKLPITIFKIDKRIVPWLMMYICLPILSIINGIELSEFFIAMTRYLALVPFVFWGIINIDIFHNLTDKILKIFVLVTIASAILMVYQLIFGKIAFFAEVTERVGYSRYSSLLGSPTSYGTLAPLTILILNTWKIFKKKWTLFFQLIIVVGGILSLSKAFFVNLALCIGLSIINNSSFGKKINAKTIKKIVGGILGLIVVAIVFLTIASKTVIGDYFSKMLNYSFNNQYNGVTADLIIRLTELPRKAFEYHTPNVIQLLFGIGFKGYSGVLGLANYPMCHNDYFSLILAQGILFFVILMVLYVQIIVKCVKNKTVHSIFSLNLIIYLMINMFAGQWNYLTTFSMVFFMITISELRNSSIVNNK